ncbi:OadG family transporter subunit [Intestinibacter sp.]
MSISQLFEALKISSDTLSIGDKLIGSLSVTLLSIVTVFIILSIIAFIISLLQIEKKPKSGASADVSKNTANQQEGVAADEVIDETDDLELVAAITVAIEAFNNNGNKIIVKKIVRNTNIKSNWELNK